MYGCHASIMVFHLTGQGSARAVSFCAHQNVIRRGVVSDKAICMQQPWSALVEIFGNIIWSLMAWQATHLVKISDLDGWLCNGAVFIG